MRHKHNNKITFFWLFFISLFLLLNTLNGKANEKHVWPISMLKHNCRQCLWCCWRLHSLRLPTTTCTLEKLEECEPREKRKWTKMSWTMSESGKCFLLFLQNVTAMPSRESLLIHSRWQQTLVNILMMSASLHQRVRLHYLRRYLSFIYVYDLD